MNVEMGEAFLDALVRVAKLPGCDRVLLIAHAPLAGDKLKAIKKKVIYAVSAPHLMTSLQEEGFEAVVLPGLTSGRMDRLKSALVGAVSSGYVKRGESVVVAMSREESKGAVDTMMHITAGEMDEESSSLAVTSISSDIPPQLLEVLVDLALRIGREGYEGRPVGTLIVVGDSTAVMEKSHPLTLNPFQGYSEVERNLFDAHVRGAGAMDFDAALRPLGLRTRVEWKPATNPDGSDPRFDGLIRFTWVVPAAVPSDERAAWSHATSDLSSTAGQELKQHWDAARFQRTRVGLVPKLGPRTLGIDLYA